jgi:hypothetical protein
LFGTGMNGVLAHERNRLIHGIISARYLQRTYKNAGMIWHSESQLSQGTHDLTLSRSILSSQRHAISEKSSSDYEASSELDELRDTSMSKGRFFSIVEREARNFMLSKQVPLRIRLEKNFSTKDGTDAYVLVLKPKVHISKAKVDALIDPLKRTVFDRLNDNLERIPKSEKLEFSKLVDNLEIHAQNKTVFDAVDLENSDLQRYSRTRRLLGLDEIIDIHGVIGLVQNDHILERISSSLYEDIKIRDKKHKTDSIANLYEYNQLLPTDCRLQKPRHNDLKGNIHQALRAIILSEYQARCKAHSTKFLDKRITYDDYINALNSETKLSLKFW